MDRNAADTISILTMIGLSFFCNKVEDLVFVGGSVNDYIVLKEVDIVAFF